MLCTVCIQKTIHLIYSTVFFCSCHLSVIVCQLTLLPQQSRTKTAWFEANFVDSLGRFDFQTTQNFVMFLLLVVQLENSAQRLAPLFALRNFLYEKECSTIFLTFSKLYSPAKGKSRDYFYYDQIPFVLCLCHIWHSCLIIHYMHFLLVLLARHLVLKSLFI